MEFDYRRDEETGIYKACIEFGHEHATFRTEPGITKVMWTSDDDVQLAYKAAEHAFGEPNPTQPGFVHAFNKGGGEWSLPPELRDKRSPKTILGIIATRPDDIYSLAMIHNATQINWYQYMLHKSWPEKQRHSMLGLESAHPLGQSALRALFLNTASKQLREHSDEIFSHIEVGDFWLPERSELPRAADQPMPLHNAA